MDRRPTLGIADLNNRSREIFRQIVETYLDSGEPVGSRTLSQTSGLNLSPASIRNVMADLEDLGLLKAPHTSAGRLPTDLGLRMFVDGLLEIGDLSEDERRDIESRIAAGPRTIEDVLTEATAMLSGLSRCAGLVMAPTFDAALKHIEFVNVAPGRALAVIVGEDGNVENRLMELPAGITPSALQEAANYLNARLRGRTLDEVRAAIAREIQEKRAELDALAAQVVEAGLATWSGDGDRERPASLIVRGQSKLLEDLDAVENLERIRRLFDDLEGKEDLVRVLENAKEGEGVRIFIGSENQLFSLSGSSVVVSPYMNAQQKIVGVIGVIGPTRLNYARIIPMVDYTARVVSQLLR